MNFATDFKSLIIQIDKGIGRHLSKLRKNFELHRNYLILYIV